MKKTLYQIGILAMSVFILGLLSLANFQKNTWSSILSSAGEQVSDMQSTVETAVQSAIISEKFPEKDVANNSLYVGRVYHIFFHSLIVYPKLAYLNDGKGKMYKDYMITKNEFEKILESLYKNNFVLIDLSSVYTVDNKGDVARAPIYIPKGKKPLVISLDDLNYYTFMKGRGFANKLVLDSDGNVATEIITPEGVTTVTRDGDVVPLLDDFVKLHPDFSMNGTKGTIALTGFQGILGYRTQAKPLYNALNSATTSSSSARSQEIEAVKPVVEKLKNTGWKFASHSYSHEHSFLSNEISLAALMNDTKKWKDEVGSIVGDTDMFIGPFGQIFTPQDPRRQYLVGEGYKMLGGVGMDLYLHYFSTYVAMNRADIDGYRITHNPNRLKIYFDASQITEDEN